uniref:Uncharacterized protein n=1 Tax=Oryza sativa subsp. japonica TaxID=39947 RepID=Q5Z8W8_ORYSJ|nr:hypothetical protein [Oryza sativa Japonica Group]
MDRKRRRRALPPTTRGIESMLPRAGGGGAPHARAPAGFSPDGEADNPEREGIETAASSGRTRTRAPAGFCSGLPRARSPETPQMAETLTLDSERERERERERGGTRRRGEAEEGGELATAKRIKREGTERASRNFENPRSH